MEKFRAAVEIAKIIGKERKLEREREENAKGECGCDKGSEVEGNEEQQAQKKEEGLQSGRIDKETNQIEQQSYSKSE